MSFSQYLKVPFHLVPGFIALLGNSALHGTDNTTAYFAVHDKDIRDSLKLYLEFPDGYGGMSPREWLETQSFDAQRLDALKML